MLFRSIPAARQLVEQLISSGCNSEDRVDLRNAFRMRQLAFAHLVYLEAIQFMLENGVGSRGSSIVLDPAGTRVNAMLDDAWKIQLEDPAFKSKALLTQVSDAGEISNTWEPVREIPEIDAWFETTWAAFRNGEIYGCKEAG